MFQLLAVIIEHGVMDLNHPFSYAYKGDKTLLKGMRVKVKFGHNELIGFIVKEPQVISSSLEEYNSTSPFEVKEVIDVIDDEPIINDELIDLALEASDYYLCPFIEILKVMLPPSLRPDTMSLSKPKRSFKEVYVIAKDIDDNCSSNEKKLYEKMKNHPEGMKKSDISSKSYLSLLNKGIIKKEMKENLRLPEVEPFYTESHELNEEQKKAFDEIENSNDKTYLLEGVTGSGKTEVYIKLIEKELNKGMGSIVLVPEISLTDMMISRFKAIFGDKVALIHSGLTDSQKYDEYLRIARGDALIVVGARSAIFAPVRNLSLIIIDEEHVESYKQDVMPYYDARKIALLRAKKEGRKVVFGSATPSLECKARADKGNYHLVTLKNRFNDIKLPEVEVVDLSDYNNIDVESSMISIPLRKEIQKTLDEKKQVILLLNRRGYSPIYICRSCQKVLKCPNCNLPLTFHKEDHSIKCHHCDYELEEKDLVCPKCGGKDFIYSGFGTQRIQEELQSFFPEARIVRFDADSVKKKGQYHQIITDFSSGKYDIMIGTQMVAKGHDFPKVGLAVALMADQSLMFPSYKANEDTFDLLTQLAGRAGRKQGQGKAIIQTYSKDNPIIDLACKQDYEAFYKFEMNNRKERMYPPYTYLINIIISGKDRNKTQQASMKIKNYLISKLIKPKLRTDLYGPSIPYIEKKANRYYRMIMIKYKSRELINQVLHGINVLQLDASDIKVSIDVDPSSDIM